MPSFIFGRTLLNLFPVEVTFQTLTLCTVFLTFTFLYQKNQQKYCLSQLSFHTDAKSEIYLKIACLI